MNRPRQSDGDASEEATSTAILTAEPDSDEAVSAWLSDHGRADARAGAAAAPARRAAGARRADLLSLIEARPADGLQVVTAPVTDRRGAGVRLRDVRHRYGSGPTAVTVLDRLDLEVPPGGYLALMGASGAGKSTALALIGGLERPQHGSVIVGGHDLTCLAGRRLAEFRRRTVGFVFQHFGLLDTLTAQENVELAMALDGARGADRRARALELLDAVGLSARAGHRPSALSGGERQRVAIARALANRPRLLLADEPTGNLDTAAAHVVLSLLGRLRAEHGCTVVVVTHNPDVARRADDAAELVRGRLMSP